MGIQATGTRLKALVEDTASGQWRRNEQRITELSEASIDNGVDKTYWLQMRRHDEVPIVAGSRITIVVRTLIELARFFGGGDLVGGDFDALHQDLADDADLVAQQIMHTRNYSQATTGLLLVHLRNSSLVRSPRRLLIWQLEFEMTIREAWRATEIT